MPVPYEGHRERVRQRMRQMRIEDVRSLEVLEYLLFYALPRRDTKPIAYELLEKFGSLEAVLDADEKALTEVKGVGPRTARWLKIMRRAMNSYEALKPVDKPTLSTLEKAVIYLKEFFADCPERQVWQFCLNASGRLIGCMKIADYTCWCEPAYVRKALEQAIMMRAHNVVLCHFSGDEVVMIDEDEYDAIDEYGYSLSVTGIRLMDYIIYSRSGYVSMARRNARIVKEGGILGDVTGMMYEAALESGYLEDWV